MEQMFVLRAPTYLEFKPVIKAFLSRDETRPVITGVNVRFRDGQAAFEATDSYGLVRVQVMCDDALLGPEVEPFNVLVPGAEFLSLAPAKDRLVTFRLERHDVVDPDTGEIGVKGVSSITDGITTVRLEHVDRPELFPQFDRLISEQVAEAPVQGRNLCLSGGMVGKKLDKLPGPLLLRLNGETRAILFNADGEGREGQSPAEYLGALMPIRREDDEKVAEWQEWAA
jgi:hypothetical protein